MNGPDHYRKAERLISLAEGYDWEDRHHGQQAFAEVALAAAQVHATLAQVAAAVGDDPDNAWSEVLA